ncbi:MAG TPA: ATP-binding protein [Candidatus Limnocylindria bacterium]|nr:ATP-binding protein [Candidatus Limnocylindria bacterium]
MRGLSVNAIQPLVTWVTRLFGGGRFWRALSPWLLGYTLSLVAGPSTPLTHVSNIRELTSIEASNAIPVALEGVLTFVDRSQYMCFFQDASGGIYLSGEATVDAQSGQRVRITGATASGDLTPIVGVSNLVVLGRSPKPSPKPASFVEFKSGLMDAEWVEIQGYLRSSSFDQGWMKLKVGLPEGSITVWTRDTNGAAFSPSLAAHIRARGVCAGVFGDQNEILDFGLFASDINDLAVISQPPVAADQLPVRPVNRLNMDWHDSGLLQARCRGRVTLHWPGRFLFVEDETGSVELRLDQKLALIPGDEVDAIGFRQLAHRRVVLEDCLVTKRSSGPAPVPHSRTLEQIYSRNSHGELAIVEGRLAATVDQLRNRTPSLQRSSVESGPVLFMEVGQGLLRAELPPGTPTSEVAGWHPGSILRLTGVLAADANSGNQSLTYRMLLQSPAAVEMRIPASWWTPRRTLLAGGAGTLIIMGGMGWVVGIVQRLRRRAEKTIYRNNELTIRHQAILLELARLAPPSESPDNLAWLGRFNELIAETLEVARASVWRFEEEGGVLRCLDLYSRPGYHSAGATLTTAAFPVYFAALAERRVIAAHDAQEDPITRELKDSYLVGLGITSILDVPLRLRGRPVGVLCLEHIGPRRHWTPSEESLAAGAADQLNILLEGRERAKAELALREAHTELELRVMLRTTELAEARDRAESADRLKSAFLAAMSHELRTPMNSIIGFTGIILQGMGGPLTPEQQKQLGMVMNSARHLLSLINDILDLSKIEAGQMELHPEPFEVADAVQKAMQMVAPLAARKDLAMRSDVSSGIGAITNDRRRVEQILINLLNNAIKFTERGHIRVECDRTATVVRIHVHDTGIGIAPEHLPCLFQPFRQLDSGLSRQHEGTGLGLAICGKLAKMIKGVITVSSTVGLGSTFTLVLPLDGNQRQ